jgi:hypothetical protein
MIQICSVILGRGRVINIRNSDSGYIMALMGPDVDPTHRIRLKPTATNSLLRLHPVTNNQPTSHNQQFNN